MLKFSHFFQCCKKVPLQLYRNEGGRFHSYQARVRLGLGCDPGLWGRPLPRGSRPALVSASAVRAFPAPGARARRPGAALGRGSRKDMERRRDFKLSTLQGALSWP